MTSGRGRLAPPAPLLSVLESRAVFDSVPVSRHPRCSVSSDAATATPC